MFWVGDGAAAEALTASELLIGFESGRYTADTPVRTKAANPPKPLRRYIRELVWLSQTHTGTTDDALFRTAFDNAPFGMVYSNLVGQVIRANRAFADMLGYEPDEIIGTYVRQHLAPDSHERETRDANALLTGSLPRSEREKLFVHKSGALVETLTALAVVPDGTGAPAGAVGHVLDLRELLALRQELAAKMQDLRDSEKRFEDLFRQAPHAMVMVDTTGRIVDSNALADALFGSDIGRLEGRLMENLVPDWGDMGTSRDAWRTRARRLDDAPFTASIGVTNVDIGGSIVTVAGLTDVTEEDAAKAELSKSLQEKETLLKEIHHRVKNNLQMVSSLLNLQSGVLKDPDARSLVQECARRVQSMSLIHKQLYGRRSLSRIDFGAFAIEIAETQRAAMAPDLRLRVQTEPCEVPIQVALPLALILNELITNGIKYGIPGSTSPERRIDADVDLLIEVRRTEHHLSLSVTDGGPGLADDRNLARSATLGMRLITSLARQVRATVSYDGVGGTRAEVVCALGPHTTHDSALS